MSDEQPKTRLACWRVDDVPNPRPGAVQHDCDQCSVAVWAMPANLSLGLRVLCRSCALIEALIAGDAVVTDARLHPQRACPPGNGATEVP